MESNFGAKMRDMLLKEMMGSLEEGNGEYKWRVLILDPLTTKILSSAIKMSDLHSKGISHVEDLTKGRQPLALEAVYYISPSYASIDTLMTDFSKDPLYPGAHVFFSSKIPTDGLLLIQQCKKLKERLRSLKEMNMEILALDSRSFHTDQPEVLPRLFGHDTQQGNPTYDNEMETIVTRLATVFQTLKEFPTIRYHNPDTTLSTPGTGLMAKIAKQLDERLFDLQKNSQLPSENTCDLLLLDRGYDPVAPVIHEWTYEPMVYDLLSIDGNVYVHQSDAAVEEGESKEVVLGEQDELWREFRHMHIAEASNAVNEKMDTFRQKNVAARFGGASNLNTKDMRKLIQALPEYREFLSRLGLHIDITRDLFQMTHDRKLKDIGELEQDMVYGDKHSKDLITWLQLNKDALPQDKMRLFMCYLATHPEKMDTDRRLQYQKLAQLKAEEMTTILNLEYLGISVTKKETGSLLTFGRRKKKATRKERESDKLSQQYALARFQPLLADLLEDLAANNLSQKTFPCIREPQKKAGTPISNVASVRTKQAKYTWAQSKTAGLGESSNRMAPTQQKIIVFIVGGITRSEMRVAHKISPTISRDVILGGTAPLSPTSFIKSMSRLSSVSSDMVALNIN